jgi:O-antigen/teichoic acid export membrane protein
MLQSRKKIVAGFSWTVLTFVISLFVRFLTSIVLTRLLAPEILGIAVIVNTIRLGVELLSDTGAQQFVIQSKDGDDPDFLNTVWTIQLIRGVVLAGLLVLLSGPLAETYSIEPLYIWFGGLVSLIYGFQSVAFEVLKRKMQVAKVTVLELVAEVAGGAIAIGTVYFYPTAEAVLFAAAAAAAFKVILSHAIATDRSRFRFRVDYAWSTFHFGKWIFMSSIFMFLCVNFDRLYLGSVAPLALFGIYGIARSLADLPNAMAQRIGYVVVYPLIASSSGQTRPDVRSHVSPLRRRLLIAAALAFAVGVSISDRFVMIVYDHRYIDAAWMLPILLVGVWPSVLTSTGESTLLGLGKPVYAGLSNGLKLGYLVVAVPFMFSRYGMLGAVVAMALSDLVRYLPLLAGQVRERLSFIRQDAVATAIFLAALALLTLVRQHYGFGTPFDAIPSPSG